MLKFFNLNIITMQIKIILFVILFFKFNISFAFDFNIRSNSSIENFTSNIIVISTDYSNCLHDEICVIKNFDDFSIDYDFYLSDNKLKYFKIKSDTKFVKYILNLDLKNGDNFITIKKSNLNNSNSNIVDIPFSDYWSNDLSTNIQGVEPVVLKNDNLYLMYFRGNSDKNFKNKVINYGELGVLKFTFSYDGIIWNEPVDLLNISGYQGQPFVYKDASGFHLFFNDGFSDNIHNYQYWYSQSGLPNSFKLINKNFLKLNHYPGNIFLFNEKNSFHFFYESLHLNKFWAISKYSNSSLTPFREFKSNPLISFKSKMIGGQDIVKVNNIFFMFAHQGEDIGEGNMPTSLVRYKSFDLINWTKVGWELFRENVSGIESQIADPSIVLENNKLLIYYEEMNTQSSNKLPFIRMATINKSPKLFFDPNFTKTKGSDLKAEGWIFEEHDSVNLKSVFRKSSKINTLISDNALYVKTGERPISPHHYINLLNKDLTFIYKNLSSSNHNNIINLNNDLVKIISNENNFLVNYGDNKIFLCANSASENIFNMKVHLDFISISCNGSNPLRLDYSEDIYKFGFKQANDQFSIYSGFIVKNFYDGVKYVVGFK